MKAAHEAQYLVVALATLPLSTPGAHDSACHDSQSSPTGESSYHLAHDGTRSKPLKGGIRNWRICEPITPPTAPTTKFRAGSRPLVSKSPTAKPPAIPVISQMREIVSSTISSFFGPPLHQRRTCFRAKFWGPGRACGGLDFRSAASRRPSAARRPEQVVYVATEIATQRAGISRDGNGQRTPRPLRSANKSVRFEVQRYQQDWCYSA